MDLRFVVVVAALAGCSKMSPEYASADKAEPVMATPSAMAPPPPPAPMEERARDAKEDSPKMAMKKAGDPSAGMGKDMEADEAPTSEVAVPAAPTRSWFPETFLFAPRVITDDNGNANVDVLVPDRLTTWRVLALAHSRNGAQSGTLTTLISNLPVSVDVVVPPFLLSGDRVALPFQVVNSTDAAVTRALTAKVEGARLFGLAGSIKVDAQGSTTTTATLETPLPGEVTIEANVGSDDSVRRTIEVRSGGRPTRVEHSGTLAAERAFSLPLEPGVLPGTTKATLTVFPGALAILKAELQSAPDRSSVDDDAYLLSLTGRAKALGDKLGAPVDDKVLLRLTRLATQRAARRTVNPDLMSAMRLAPGALAHDPTTLLARNGEHLASFVARAQRPDGTFAGGDGWPLQRLIVATADGLNAVRAAKHTEATQRRAAAATLRARGAFERFAKQIEDPYTAAVVVASGAVQGEQLTTLRALILKALEKRGDGSMALPVPEGVTRADGSYPSEIEATATAILALHDDPAASTALPDLGATVLSAYRPGRGFGDGATNGVALDAVALLFAAPLPTRVVVSLRINDKPAGSDVLEGKRLQEVLTLDANLADVGDLTAGALDVVVSADPSVPGLSYVLAVKAAVPWPRAPADAGLNLTAALEGELKVGATSGVVLRAVAPGGSALKVTHGLPAGVDAVRASLQQLITEGVISSYELNDGVVVLNAPSRNQGELFTARFKIVPTLAGSLHTQVSSAELAGQPSSAVYFPPAVWTIKAN
ncbi:MAG: alpha-2-macroglobulin family protein [Deltaproteobacteria bacterium]|nr:alpha-2-macroglobulin family protein [Deltaproteobacteria bacterium]